MPSRTEVANHALDMVNQSPISDLDGTDAKSQRCKRIYEMCLDILLEKESWNFAQARVSIATDSDQPLNGYTYQYTLPADCKRPIRINDDDTEVWEEEGGKILTDSASPIILEYVQRVTNPNLWHASFIEAFTAYLASRYAKAFAQDNDKSTREYQEYKEALGEAFARNGQSGTPPTPAVKTLTTNIRRY